MPFGSQLLLRFLLLKSVLVDTSDIFTFCCSGEGQGEFEASGRRAVSVFLIEKLSSKRGGGSPGEGVVGRGAGRVSAINLGRGG